jgi:hypothetical protein
MDTKLFTNEFLDILAEKAEEFSVLDYIMESKNLSFHDAVLDLARYCELKPEYIERKK